MAVIGWYSLLPAVLRNWIVPVSGTILLFPQRSVGLSIVLKLSAGLDVVPILVLQ